jgi:hypothetical protein
MHREALDSAEQVAQAGRGSDGASVVERGELTLISRPSGRTERAWRLQPTSSEQPPHARACCDLSSSRRYARSIRKVLHQGEKYRRHGVTMILFACISAIFFSFFLLKTTTSLRGDTDTDDTHAFLSIKYERKTEAIAWFQADVSFFLTALSFFAGCMALVLLVISWADKQDPWLLLV